MRKLLLQLDSSRLPSVFDRVVAYDGGADEVMSYGGIAEADVRDLIHGCIFTRGPKDLKNTAVFVGGADIAAGEQLLAAATKAMFKPFTVSAMLDSNGSNTTAVAAVAKMVKAVGDVRGKRVLIVAGTGPVGIRAAGLFAKAGAGVCITSRKADAGLRARGADPQRRTGGGEARPEAGVGEPAGAQGHRGRECGSPARHRGGRCDGRRRDEGRRGVLRRTRYRKPQDEGAQGVHCAPVRAQRPRAGRRDHRRRRAGVDGAEVVSRCPASSASTRGR